MTLMSIELLVGRTNVYGIFIPTTTRIYFKLDSAKYLKFSIYLLARSAVSKRQGATEIITKQVPCEFLLATHGGLLA